MASQYDTAFLLAQIRRLSFAPTAAATGTQDSDLLAFANFELQGDIVPKLRRASEEYNVVTVDLAITGGVDTYAIPTRASVAALRDVWLIRSDASLRYLPRVQMEDVPLIRGSNPVSNSEPAAFYIRGNNVILFPNPGTTSGSLRFHYFQRPSQLVTVAEVAVITGINTGTGVVACTGGMGTGFAATASYGFDFVKSTPHFDIWGTDKSGAVNGTNITFAAADLPANLAVGDHVALAGQTAVPQIPFEMGPLLIQLVVIKVLEGKKDTEALMSARTALEKIADSAFTQMAPRVDGKPKILSNRWWL